MKKTILFYILASLFFSCAQKNELKKPTPDDLPVSGLSGKELAQIHCARCHTYVPPSSLSKSVWQTDVLPAMGNRLGIYNGSKQPDSIFGSPRNSLVLKKVKIYPEKALLARDDWQKLVDYYIENSPEVIPEPQRNTPIAKMLRHFKYKEPSFKDSPPLTAMVKILPHKKGLVFSDSKRNNNRLTFLNTNLEKEQSVMFRTTPIHYHETGDTVYLTTIGNNIFPNDLSDGAVQQLNFTEGKAIRVKSPIIKNMQRPVHMAYGDLNADGREDILACEYGDLTGKLVWYEKKSDGGYQAHLLKKAPGAIKAIIKDYNGDGFNDIFVLMAQGNEGVFYFENTGKGHFVEKQLLSFSPLNGSQSMELADFNEDGFDDILYVCGDNADKTPFLKDYHGSYIFLNDGHLNFEKAFFYAQNGAYKAISNDYDLDGDLDIAIISFFPDYLNAPEESFVYLENKGNLDFEASSFPQASKGRWIVMDAGDIDGDGDIDLALGSFVQFLAKGDTTGLSKRWLTESPSVIILENTIK